MLLAYTRPISCPVDTSLHRMQFVVMMMDKSQTGKNFTHKMGIQTGAGVDGSILEGSRVGISCHSGRVVSLQGEDTEWQS